jgi:hypothetical protein
MIHGGIASTKRFPKRPDLGASYLWKHTGLERIAVAANQAPVLRATEENLLDRLHLARWLSASEHAAGLRFLLDFWEAGLGPHLSGSYNPDRSNKYAFGIWEERSEKEERAYRRWRWAVAKMGRFADPVISVACHEQEPTPRQLLLAKEGLRILAEAYDIQPIDIHNKDVDIPQKNLSSSG